MISDDAQSKKRGRPPTGTNEAIGVRMSPPQLAAIDAWRRKQPDLPGRPEAIRRLVEQALANPKRSK